MLRVVYDVNSCPDKLGMQNMVKIMESHRVIFWDSTKDGVRPKLFADPAADLTEEEECIVVDLKGKDIDLEMYQRKYEDDLYWDKELHNCKGSPIYFYKNYLTREWPVTNEGIKKYLKEIGLQDLSKGAKDSGDAAKQWEAQKAKVKEATKNITIEQLKELKPVVDVLRFNYEQHIIELEASLKDKVGLFDNKGQSFDVKKKTAKLIDKIKKFNPVPPQYSETYRTKKGRWDYKILFATDYGVLLEIADDLFKNHNIR